MFFAWFSTHVRSLPPHSPLTLLLASQTFSSLTTTTTALSMASPPFSSPSPSDFLTFPLFTPTHARSLFLSLALSLSVILFLDSALDVRSFTCCILSLHSLSEKADWLHIIECDEPTYSTWFRTNSRLTPHIDYWWPTDTTLFSMKSRLALHALVSTAY